MGPRGRWASGSGCATTGTRLLSQFSAGLILWTHALASRTHARLERYLLHDPLPHLQHGDLGEMVDEAARPVLIVWLLAVRYRQHTPTCPKCP